MTLLYESMTKVRLEKDNAPEGVVRVWRECGTLEEALQDDGQVVSVVEEIWS